ncbi:MAG: hypothetical protein N2A42_08870 [Luteolibacter sp.]|jgi:hypothetical protein
MFQSAPPGWGAIAEEAGEEAGLDVGEETEGDFLVDEWVLEGVLFTFLPGGEDFFAAVGF